MCNSKIVCCSKECKHKEIKPVLTYGAVRAGPVGLADADPRVRVEGAVTGALLWTSALQDITADPSPAGVTVALAVVTGSMTRAHGVQTVHYRHTCRDTNDITSTQAVRPPHLPPAAGTLSASVCHRGVLQGLQRTASPTVAWRFSALLWAASNILTA